jgi:dipeptidase
MEWEGDANGDGENETYLSERAIATQQTGFWFVGQARNWVSPCTAGILWFGTDDAATSPLTPIYTSSTEVPWCFNVENGSMTEYSESSMFWVTTRISNFAYLRYDAIGGEVRGAIDEWENARLAEIATIDEGAKKAHEQGHDATLAYLTDYSKRTAEWLFNKWDSLDKYLLVKYMDGNVKIQNPDGSFKDNGNGAGIPEMPEFPGYDKRWRDNVAAGDDGTLLVPAAK